jgi:tubulin monoglycylase TTLL3/8
LTNDAVQKKSDEYGKFETGNKLTLGEYQAYLSKFYPELKIDFRTHIFSQIKQIMTDTFRATYKIIAPTRDMQHHTFEIFGFDFMLDEDFKVYLIEVNTNPCLETTCPILSKIITDMVDNAFKVAIDPLYPPPNH